MIYIKWADNGFRSGNRVSCNSPCPTIITGGIGGTCSSYWLENNGRDILMRKDDKPLYYISSMEEIAMVELNGFNIVSIFSGCGGSCLGFRMAGFKILWANEFVPAAQECYRLNFPGSILDGRDIRKVQPGEILKATGLAKGELDVLDGSPPCQSFSMAGARARNWGKRTKHGDGSEQRSDDLFFEYVRLLRGLGPRAFVAENVAGLVMGKAKGYFKAILCELKGCGYAVQARVLDAQWLGVPQARRRVIFVGVREDLGLEPVFPCPLPYRYSVLDTCPWMTTVIHDESGQWPQGDVTRRPSPTIRASRTGILYSIEPESSIEGTAIGEEWDKIRTGERSGKYFQLSKQNLREPSSTITALGGERSVAVVVHPTEKRKFSIAELKRICSFPDDFQLTGSYSQQWARLGNSVPPLMMKTIAEVIRDQILLK